VFLLNMNQLFEDFVTRLITHAMAGTDVQVRPQHRNRSILIDERTGGHHGTVIPDLLLTRDAWRLVVDAKYKLYDERHLAPGDLYQAFLYAHALSQAGPPPQMPTAVLIHPGETLEPQRIRIHRADGRPSARVRTMALNLHATLPALHDQSRCAELYQTIRANLTG
jgi:5-methylcytosine-specific restriction enzyme subunit McrC